MEEYIEKENPKLILSSVDGNEYFAVLTDFVDNGFFGIDVGFIDNGKFGTLIENKGV